MDSRAGEHNESVSRRSRQIEDESCQPDKAGELPTAVRHRLALFLLGNLLPSFYLFFASRAFPNRPLWQTGEFRSYIALLLTGDGGLIFFPFLLYSIGCFSVSIFWPQLASRYFYLRLGVATGVVLSLQYCFLGYAAVMQANQFGQWTLLFIVAIAIPLTALVVVGVPVVTYRLVSFFGHRWSSRPLTWHRFLFIGALPVVAAVAGSLISSEDAVSLLPYFIILPVAIFVWSVPYWMLAVYGYQTRRLLRDAGFRGQVRLHQLLAIVSWLAAYFAAWRYSVTETLIAYSQLPKDPPSTCYVATAAASAHPWLVQSWNVTCRNGATCRVTMQLAHLKCAEIVIACTAPTAHRQLRICTPWVADLVYIGLKPLEWSARAFVALAVPDAVRNTRELYRPAQVLVERISIPGSGVAVAERSDATAAIAGALRKERVLKCALGSR
jgi:hypothetical protein